MDVSIAISDKDFVFTAEAFSMTNDRCQFLERIKAAEIGQALAAEMMELFNLREAVRKAEQVAARRKQIGTRRAVRPGATFARAHAVQR
jgi:hypothetical protein